MIFETAVAKIAAGAVLAGGATVGVHAATNDCPTGQEQTVWGCAVVKEFSGETRKGIATSSVTFDVTFRDERGNRTDSGIGAEDQFQWLGGKKQGINGDGQLIEVKQTTTHKGGWGSLYEGWIPVKYTQAPTLFK